ncbi:MAG: hypothetical protein SO108_05050 [Bacilli bacterium]|nr:hypothetical protein [Bacilli bacterium]
MENTDNYYVQPEGIWIIDEEKNTAFRMKGGIKVELPITTEILEEVKKQIEAEKYFNLFQDVKDKNEMIIGYLKMMLGDYYNYLSHHHQKEFLQQIQSISHLVDDKNSSYLQEISACLKKQNLDAFYDVAEEFQQYNQSYFNGLNDTKQEGRHLS